MAVDLSLSEARRIALRAQGFGARPASRVGLGQLSNAVSRVGAVQIDAVNVLARSHYLGIYSRVGRYDPSLLDDLVFERGGAFEYIAHAAAVVTTELYPALRWRMADHAQNKYWVGAKAVIEERNPGYLDRVLQEVVERGPLSFQDLTDPARRPRPKTNYAESSILWWSKRPSDGKHVLEGLWREGRLAVAGRTPSFERIFDLAERVIPAEALDAPPLDRQDGIRVLLLHAARALGVGWPKDFSSYFALSAAETKKGLRELIEAGSLEVAHVEGSSELAYLDPGAASGAVTAAALVSPFDSLLWERNRNTRLFGFRHSFEIYVPEAKRQYGYYVLPFLLDESIVARVDLKADRQGGALLVQAAYAEEEVSDKTMLSALAAEIEGMASWLGLDRVAVKDRGNAAAGLRLATPPLGGAR
jgi:uncharacterized protein